MDGVIREISIREQIFLRENSNGHVGKEESV